MSPREEPLSVVIPPPERDRPAWARVGVVAATGFAIGIVWPQLTGSRLAPSPPSDAPAAAVVEPARPATSASPAAPVAAANAAAAAPAAPSQETVTVGQGAIVRCRDAKGKAREDCGALPFDPLAHPRIRELAKCPAASRASGKLAIGLDVDFKRKTVHVQRSRGSTLPRSAADALLKCAAAGFANVGLDDIEHAYARYTVVYVATFAPPGGAAEAPGGDAAPVAAGTTTNELPASGTATVAFDAAVVRDAPKGTNVVGRVLRGGKVRLLGRQNDWYHVSFGATPREGWMHRSALGI